MADKIKLLIQKRTSLKIQITTLANAFEKGKVDNTTLKLRSARLTELYRAYKDYNDELAILNPSDSHEAEFENIQERFYALASKIERVTNTANTSISNASTSGSVNRSVDAASPPPAKRRRVKLPESSLPTFDGTFENWLSFKNAFIDAIDTQTDLSDIDKLHYLRSALIGEAANKLKILTVDKINYSRAWEFLERAYEVKRVLISRHLSAILNLPIIDKETTSSLTKLADETQEHVASLSALGVSIGSEMLTHILESKLPKITSEKWEATLERDEFPKPDQLYEFIYKTAVCASKREKGKATDSQKMATEMATKKKHGYSTNKAFVLDASRKCVACKTKIHPLYSCDKFKQWPITKRIEVVKKARLCYNCLRSHRGNLCKFSNCTVCKKRYNTLLHNDNYTPVNKTDTSQAESKTE
ncbi:uncharacterized protein LOC118644290 [Monomorium pharaonis]|uniref:uncharacterized protein LOC118644290 n=1 Tax=Monomorium pharaonis TaxID=307658 RepID=UPI00174782F0|nr:uncharacterized protein LOC118644290 [Monomorium pharaonis]